MSLLANTTNANTTTAYFLRANAQLINVSTLNAGNIEANTISTNALGVSSLVAEYMSSINLDSEFVNTSTINTLHVDLDGQILTATPTELLLNGIPIATQSSLSSIADWSLDPAISTVQMDGNDLNAAGLVSSQSVRAGNGVFNNLVAFNSLFVSSNTSTISSVIDSADLGIFSTISAGTIIAPVFEGSSITVNGLISTPDIEVSTINGAAFGTSSITVDVVGVSTLVATSISSVGAAIREALISTIVFSPSLNPSLGGVNVNLGLGGILGNVIGWGAGVFGAAAGTVGLVTGMVALATGRQTENLDPSRYELVNTTTQLQFSTLGTTFSTIYRFNQSTDPERVPGEEIFISTINPAGLAVRSVSDPIYTLSTPNSTIQAFGQWVPVPEELVNVSSFSTVAVSSIVPLASSIAIEQSINNLMVLEPSTITIDGEDQIVIRADNANSLAISGSQSTVTLSAASSLSLFAGVAGVGNIQMYAPNVVMDQNLVVSSINGVAPSSDWANYPAVSTINFSTGVTAVVAASAGSEIALTGTAIKLIGGYTDAFNKIVVSTISTAIIEGANNNLFGIGAQGLEIRTEPTGTVWISSPQTNIAGLTNTSTVASFLFRGGQAAISSATVSSLAFYQAGTYGLSSLMYLSTSFNPTQGTSTTLYVNTDLTLGQNDIYAQQIRLGRYTTDTSNVPELIMYGDDGSNKGFSAASSDKTVRVYNNAIPLASTGYILDTFINAPFFSTINQSTSMMAWFPSTNRSTIGVSTISFIPPKVVAGSFTSLSTQAITANTPLALWLEQTDYAVGGITTSTTAIVIPSPGVFELTPSIQFEHPAGAATADFWLRKNGVDIPNTASEVYLPVGGLGQTHGVTSFLVPCVANDKLEIIVASPDTNVSAVFYQSTVGAPYTKPANPSVILSIKCLNY